MRREKISLDRTTTMASTQNKASFVAPDAGMCHRSRGFSLLEVLVALLVLAIGLLGLASLQTLSIKFNHQSYEHTQATLLAYDILDRMRANPTGNYAVAIPASDPGCTGTGATCTPNNMALHDLYHWGKAIEASLAGGIGAVTVSNGIADTTLSWFENDVRRTTSIKTRL